MSKIKQWYASAPTDDYGIPTIEIIIPGYGSLRYCNGFEDRYFEVDGVPHLFEASPISVGLPKKDTSGQQTLRFGFQGVEREAQIEIDRALQSLQEIRMIYRYYLNSDITTPAERPRELVVVGGTIDPPNVVFEGSYYDLLNSAWPRDRYTVETAPGIEWM